MIGAKMYITDLPDSGLQVTKPIPVNIFHTRGQFTADCLADLQVLTIGTGETAQAACNDLAAKLAELYLKIKGSDDLKMNSSYMKEFLHALNTYVKEL